MLLWNVAIMYSLFMVIVWCYFKADDCFIFRLVFTRWSAVNTAMLKYQRDSYQHISLSVRRDPHTRYI